MIAVALSAHTERLLFARLLAAFCAAACLTLGVAAAPSVRALLWGEGLTRAQLLLLPVALAPWLACSVYYRHYLGADGLLPKRLTWFVVVAVAIGVAEELAYRGYVLGALRRHGAVLAVVAGALGHTAYKLALFVVPPAGLRVDLVTFGLYTLAGSLLLGLTREWGRGLAAPALCHALFDIIVYGDQATVPSWVWTQP